MSRSSEEMRRRPNGEISPAQLEADIDHTREEMSHTLDELGRRLSPGEIVDQALHYLRGPNQFVSNLGETVQRNTMPVLLTGIGLAWMIASGRRGSVPSGEQVEGGIGRRMDEAKSRTQETMAGTKGRIQGQAQKVKETAAQLTESVRDQGQRAKGGVQSLMRDQPLIIGALGLVFGAALGTGMPATRAERETVGQKGEQPLRAGQEKAHEVSETGQRVAESASGSVKEAAKRRGADEEKSSRHS